MLLRRSSASDNMKTHGVIQMEVGNRVRIVEHIPRSISSGKIIDIYGKIGTITDIGNWLGGKYQAEIELNIEGLIFRLYFNQSEFNVEE